MRTLPVHIWTEFKVTVEHLPEDCTSRQLLQVILSWIRLNYSYLETEPFSTYGFNGLAEIDQGVAPVEYSSFKASDMKGFKRNILKRQHKDVEAIARFLRDTIEDLVTIKIDEPCQNCETWGVRIFVGKKNRLLARQCDVCGWSQYSDGSRVTKDSLTFASESQLREYGLV